MKVTKERKERFCEALKSGASPALAARSIGISRTTAYVWKAADAAFAAAWDEASEHKIENVETTLYRMAIEKDLGAVIFFLKSHRPEIYNRRQLIGVGGDPDAPPIGIATGARDNVVFYYPHNGRHLPEPDEAEPDDEAAA